MSVATPSRRKSSEQDKLGAVFLPDDKIADILKICSAIWESADRNIRMYSEFFRDFLNDKRVFSEIEFYLPQIAHMIIHLGNSNIELSRSLERLALSISQLSMHTALQFTFIFKAALEDYQPELPDGKPNPSANTHLFNKCANLLGNIERVVVFGSSPVVIDDAAKNETIMNEIVLSSCNGNNYKNDGDVSEKSSLSGLLLFKRNTRLAWYKSKGWKPRFFKVENLVLYCYRDKECKQLLRAVSLLDCRIEIPDNDNERYPYYMEIADINASDLGQFKLSKAEETRFLFFRGEIQFLMSLTDISESLRFIDRTVRKEELKKKLSALEIPPMSYLPLCHSTDSFQCVLRALPAECHAFSTKARCPALILFELEERDVASDNASFLALELNETYDDDSALETSAPAPPISKYRKAVSQRFGAKSVWQDSSKVVVERIVRGAVRFVAVTRPAEESSSAAHSESSSVHQGGGSVSISDKAETFSERAERLRLASPNGVLPGWRLGGLIAKSNDDVRQEVFVMQLIMLYQKLFKEAGLPLWMHTYRILSTSKTTGLIELITDSISLDGLKKKDGYPGTLRLHFENSYKERIEFAVDEYVKSLAAYSVVTYLLAIKDRHNGNIMIDGAGHLVHIDFGFVFGLAPGKQFSLEKAPWKLTVEMVDVMGGLSSPHYQKYRDLCISAFRVAREHNREVEGLMNIMTYESNYPAFKFNRNAVVDFRARLMLDLDDHKVPEIIDGLLKKAYDHRGTRLYDRFQLATNKIAP